MDGGLTMRRLARRAAIGSACISLFVVGTASAAAPPVLGSGLRQLVAAWENADPRLENAMALHISNVAGDPLIRLRLTEGVKFEDLAPQLSALGFQKVAVSSLDPRLVEGYLPLHAARAAAGVLGVRSAHAVQRPRHNAGSVQSQAVALHKADLAQARGLDGTGIRIGALSDSFDTCGVYCVTTAADDIATGDLPAAGVTVLEDSPDGSDEGRAMLQLVHDIAPGAQLGFATAFSGEVEFANNILALRADFKADVIVDDVIYFDEPMYSDGLLAQAVDTVSRDGAAYFSSAGNNGLEAYEARYQPVPYEVAKKAFAAGVGTIQLDQIPEAIRPKTIHNFGMGRDGHKGHLGLTQRFTTATDNFISFQWDEPFYLGKVKTDFNIYVFDANGNWMDPSSASFPGFYTTDDNTTTDMPYEFVYLPPFPDEFHGGANASDYQIVVGKVNDGPARYVRYVNINGLGVSERQGFPSSWGHAVARGGQAVAATYYAIPTFPEDFSATGPATIRLDAAGNRLHEPDVRFVPQITAADGVDTTFFGFDSDGNGLPNFFGTSAAAPDAAAVGALVLQAAGGPGHLRPHHLYRVLQRTATRMPVPNDRNWAAAWAGPVAFSATGDWTRHNRYFGLSVWHSAWRTVQSVSFDLSTAGLDLMFSSTSGRFHVGPSNGITLADITTTRSADGKQYTLAFAPGTFHAGSEFRFGHSVFSPAQGSTQEDPDRFRGTTVTVTLDDGSAFSSKVFAAPRERINRFAGFGLVNADAAISAVLRGDHDDHYGRDGR